jgi:hypothetical protein
MSKLRAVDGKFTVMRSRGGRRLPVRGSAALVPVLIRQRPFFKHLPIPNLAFSIKRRHLEVLRQLQRVHRASIFTQPAEHAARSVVSEVREVLALRLGVAFRRNHDQLFRTSQSAKITRDTKRLRGFRVDIQPRRASIAFRNRGPFLRVLLSHHERRSLVLKRRPQTFEKVGEQKSLDQVRHQSFSKFSPRRLSADE